MRRFLVLVLLLALVLVVHFQKRPSALETLTSTPPVPSHYQPGPGPKALPKALHSKSVGELYDSLFTKNRGPWQEKEMVREARLRFARPYPREEPHHGGERKIETIARIGILKAMGKQKTGPLARQFYLELVRAKEPFLVRRQALENLKPHLARMRESDRSKALAGLPPLLVSLASLSERELLSEIWQSSGERLPAENEDKLSLNRWENLPCPSPEKFLELSSAVGWSEKEPFACDLSPTGKIGRALLLLSSIRLPFGKESGVLGENLAQPFEYLRRRSKKMVVNFQQSTIVAFNKTSLAEIHLGAIFFSSPPLDSLGTLIHEARHSDVKEDSGHFTCVQGDIPRTDGGCDKELTNDLRAGAYSYGLFFSLALAKTGLVSPSDREFLETDALFAAVRRFNRLLPRLAHFQEALAGLRKDGSVVLLHPFAEKELAPTGVPEKARYQALAYDDRSGGLLLFSRGAPKIWKWGYALNPFYEKQVPEDFPVKNAAKIRIPYESYAYSTFLDDQNVLRYLDYDKEGVLKTFRYPLKPDFSVKDFFLGSLKDSHFLSDDGRFFRMRRWGNDPDFVPLFAEQGPFFQGMGGVLKDTAFLVGEGGLLYHQELRPGEATNPSLMGDEIVEDVAVLLRSDLQTPLPALQFEEGTAFKAVLDAEGALWIQHHGEKAFSSRIPAGLSSFGLLRMIQAHGPLEKLGKRSHDPEPFRKNCGLREVSLDPWFQRGFGVANGEVIFEGDRAECLRAALPEEIRGQVESARFSAGEFGSEYGEPSHYFAPIRLELSLRDGSKREIRPYDFRK